MGAHLSIFAGFKKRRPGDFADTCIDDAALADHNWISGGKRGKREPVGTAAELRSVTR